MALHFAAVSAGAGYVLFYPPPPIRSRPRRTQREVGLSLTGGGARGSSPAPFRQGGTTDETHLPAAQCQPPPHSRVPRAHVHRGRTQSPLEPSSQGALAPRGELLQEVAVVSRSAPPAVVPGQQPGSPHVGGGLVPKPHVLAKTLPRAARVRRRADYLRVQKHSARVAAPHFVFLLTPSPSPSPSPSLLTATAAGLDAYARPRLGIIASKQLGNAVVRARAKRLVRAAFRELWPGFPAGIDVVVLVRGEVSALRFADVLVEWRGVEAAVVRRARAQLSPKTPAPRGASSPGSSSVPP